MEGNKIFVRSVIPFVSSGSRHTWDNKQRAKLNSSEGAPSGWTGLRVNHNTNNLCFLLGSKPKTEEEEERAVVWVCDVINLKGRCACAATVWSYKCTDVGM